MELIYPPNPIKAKEKYPMFKSSFSGLMLPAGFKYFKRRFVKVFPDQFALILWMETYRRTAQVRLSSIPFTIDKICDSMQWVIGTRVDQDLAYLTLPYSRSGICWTSEEAMNTIEVQKSFFEESIMRDFFSVDSFETLLDYYDPLRFYQNAYFDDRANIALYIGDNDRAIRYLRRDKDIEQEQLYRMRHEYMFHNLNPESKQNDLADRIAEKENYISYLDLKLVKIQDGDCEEYIERSRKNVLYWNTIFYK